MGKIMRENPFCKSDKRFFTGKVAREPEKFCYINDERLEKKSYVVTNYGRVISKDEQCEDSVHQFIGKRNYTRLSLKDKNGKPIFFNTNRLIAEYFVNRTKRDKELGRDLVHVIDWDGSNSRYTNLKWVNHLELYILTDLRKNPDDHELVAKSICRLLERHYTVSDIMHVMEQYIEHKDKRKFIRDIKAKKAYAYLSYEFYY